MQDNATNDATEFIRHKLANDVTEDAIRQELRDSGWSDTNINLAFAGLNPALGAQVASPTQLDSAKPGTPSSAHKNRVRNGVLWIVSPLVILIGTAMLNLILQLAGVTSPIVRIFTLLLGIAGLVLIIAGPIIGIYILSRKP